MWKNVLRYVLEGDSMRSVRAWSWGGWPNGDVCGWANLAYLGICIKKGISFAKSYCSGKIKFYRSFNAVYSTASFASEEVLCNLVKSFCLPVISYACEAVPPNKSDLNALNKAITNAFQKIFKTYDKDVISSAKLYFGVSDLADMFFVRSRKFLSRFYRKPFDFSFLINCINSFDLCMTAWVSEC